VQDDGSFELGPFYAPLQEQLSQVGSCFLVLDTVTDVANLDENKRLPVNTFCKKILGGLCRAYDLTILVNAHPSKASMIDGSYYSGATAWNNAVRNRLIFTAKDKLKPERVLEVAKFNYGSSVSLDLYLADRLLKTTRSKDHYERKSEEREAVYKVVYDLFEKDVRIVRSNGNGQKPADVAKELKSNFDIYLQPKEVLSYLNELERLGRLKYRSATNQKRGQCAGFEPVPKSPMDDA